MPSPRKVYPRKLFIRETVGFKEGKNVLRNLAESLIIMISDRYRFLEEEEEVGLS